MPPMSLARAPLASLPGIADVSIVRGARAAPDAPPDLLLEVPHGATRAAHFHATRRALVGAYPDDLIAFFFVNTDVGAPELAERIAQLVVAADPARTATVLRCLVPRTFVDCNRVVPPGAAGQASAPGEMTPGLMPWVADARDRDLLLARHAAYVSLVDRAADATAAVGGRVLMVHTYAPRSVDVAVDDRVVARLREAYAPGVVERWPLRAEVDLITTTPQGSRLAPPDLVAAVRAEVTARGLRCAENEAYALHPSTTAAALAARHPGRTLCFEVRRDLLLPAFTPFVELTPDPARVASVAQAFAAALVRRPAG